MYGGSEKLRRCFYPNMVWRQKVLLLILFRDAISLLDTWEELKQGWKKYKYIYIVPNSGLIFADVNLE